MYLTCSSSVWHRPALDKRVWLRHDGPWVEPFECLTVADLTWQDSGPSPIMDKLPGLWGLM